MLMICKHEALLVKLYKTRLYTANAINQKPNQAYHARTWHSMTESLTDNLLLRKLQVHGHGQHDVLANGLGMLCAG